MFLLLCIGFNSISGQEPVYNFYYRIFFKDKGDYNINTFYANQLLSSRAISRREKSGIPVPDFRDIPVYPGYIEQIKAIGFTLHCTSKWMNTALFKTENPEDINILLKLPFVAGAKIVKHTISKNLKKDKLQFEIEEEDSPLYNSPLTMVNGDIVHTMGYTGNGVIIAVLDAGFYSADKIPALESLRSRGGIKGTYDFIRKSRSVYDYNNHGTAVLSILAGIIPDSLEGTAPGAGYWLFRTEDVYSEFPVEEDFWAAGAEYADSIGADIITSSVGYYAFDDSAYNYKYSDLDGNTAFVTRVADIAASKGILVINSAGNERSNPWQHIIVPSDGDSVLAVGAVDASRMIALFSSAGPSFDRRVKPDEVAQGVNVPIQNTVDIVYRSNGTSLSCPVISGMCACVLQAVPAASNADIIAALHFSSDRYLTPDSLYGYGIPDFVRVIARLKETLADVPENEPTVGPNPFTNDLMVRFSNPPVDLSIEVFSYSGYLVLKKNYHDTINRAFLLRDLRHMAEGVYYIRLKTSKTIKTFKVIKLNK